MTNGPTGDPILDALKAERVRRGWSQTDLAQRIGRATYQTAYNWESGTNEPTLSSLREWAGALGFEVTLTPLAAEQPEPAPGCPTCRTILNADRAGCGDLWHADNRPEPTREEVNHG